MAFEITLDQVESFVGQQVVEAKLDRIVVEAIEAMRVQLRGRLLDPDIEGHLQAVKVALEARRSEHKKRVLRGDEIDTLSHDYPPDPRRQNPEMRLLVMPEFPSLQENRTPFPSSNLVVIEEPVGSFYIRNDVHGRPEFSSHLGRNHFGYTGIDHLVVAVKPRDAAIWVNKNFVKAS